MADSFQEILRSFRWVDALDILVATTLLTAVIQWFRNRSAHALLVAVAAVAGLYLVSQWLRMYLTMGVFRVGLPLVLISLIIIFQNDLRHGFERLTLWRPFRSRPPDFQRQKFAETLVEAVSLLAEEKSGALIVLPARENLERHFQGGVLLDGHASVPLLHSIFHSKSQGHDGAVVFQGTRITRFGVHLPLSHNLAVLGTGGTRHAAALGLAERSDALVIVVSEERGLVSLAQDGKIQETTDRQELLKRLNDFYRRPSRRWSSLREIKQLSGTALVLMLSFSAAVLLWFLFAFQVESLQRVVDQVPIETQQVPDNWVIESIKPDTLRVNIAGSKRAFNAFTWDKLAVRLDMDELEDGIQTVVIDEESIPLPPEMNVVGIEPNVLWVTAYQTETVQLPIEIVTTGHVPEGFVLKSKKSAPGEVLVKVRQSRISDINSIPTAPIALDENQSSFKRNVKLQLPEGVWPSPETPSSVDVEFEIQAE